MTDTTDANWWRKGTPHIPRTTAMPGVATICEDRRNYSPKQLADLLGLETDTVREWIRLGKLRAAHLPKGYRILGSDVNEFLSMKWARAAVR